MNTRLWVSIIIFISSYSPMVFILALRNFNSETLKFNNPYFMGFIALISIISLILLDFTLSKITGGFPIIVKKAYNRSSELVNYTIPYMISFAEIDFSKWQDMLSFALFMFLLCLLTIKTQSYFINPILAIKGYGLYEVEFEENGILKSGIFVSRIELTRDTPHIMQKLSKYLYFITQKGEELKNE